MKHYDETYQKGHDFESMRDEILDKTSSFNEISEVTLWSKSIHQVLTGMAMSSLTLNFWCLNYILPTIGLPLMLLGFRALRRENRWFKAGYIITILRCAYLISSLIINATVYQLTVYNTALFRHLEILHLSLILLLLMCLWIGFKAMQERIGMRRHAGSAVALVIWYIALCWLSAMQYSGLILPATMILCYILIIRNLFKLSEELDQAGYVLLPIPTRISNRAIIVSLCFILAVGIACGYLFLNRYPMDWQPLGSPQDSETAAIKAHLVDLGFPEAVINDLTNEDITSCEGAVHVVVETASFSIKGHSCISKNHSSLDQYPKIDNSELHFTSIGVKLSGNCEQWKIFHHFQWVDPPIFYGTESIQIWPTYRKSNTGWSEVSEFTGQLLYDSERETYAAPYYYLGSKTYIATSILGYEQTTTDTFAAFSMPSDGNNHRGYISYTVKEMQDGAIIDSWINYTHQWTILQYPTVTAMQQRISSAANRAGAFLTIQDALQFYPTDETIILY